MSCKRETIVLTPLCALSLHTHDDTDGWCTGNGAGHLYVRHEGVCPLHTTGETTNRDSKAESIATDINTIHNHAGTGTDGRNTQTLGNHIENT